MKRTAIIFLLGVLLVFLMAGPAQAAQFKANDEVNIPAEKVIDDDLYVSGGIVTIEGTVKGDLFAWGGTVTINGDVTGDLVTGGGTVIINGKVGDDAYVMGGMVTINNDVGSDVIATGGSITFGSDAKITRDLIAAGGSVIVRGDTGRKLNVGAGNALLTGRIGGKAVIEADTLKIGSTARLEGDLTYVSSKKLVMEDGANVAGRIKHRLPPKEEKKPEIPAFLAPLGLFGAMMAYVLSLIISFLWAIVSLFVVGLALALLFPRATKSVSDRVFTTPWPCIGYGLVALVVVPVLIFFLLVTVIGIPLAMIIAALFGIAVYIAKVFVCIHIGEKTIWLFNKEAKPALGWSLLLGVLIYVFLGWIPIIGGLLKLAVLLAGLGAMTCAALEYFRKPSSTSVGEPKAAVPPGVAGAVSEAVPAAEKTAQKAVKTARKSKAARSSVKPKSKS